MCRAVADYDVQYLQDSDGAVWSFHRLNGVPVVAPRRSPADTDATA